MNNYFFGLAKGLMLALVLTFVLNAKSAVYQTINSGDFNNSAIWSPSMPNPYWGWTDTIVISHNVNFNSGFTMYGTMILNESGSLIGANSLSINHQGVLVNNGTINISALSLDWGAMTTSVNNGSLTLSGALTLNYGKLTNNSNLTIGGNLTNGFHAAFENTTSGIINVQGGITNSNDLTNLGSMTVVGSFSNDYNSSISNSGIVSAGGDFTSYQNGSNSGQISSSASMVFVGQFSNDGNISSIGSITNGSGSVFSNNGELNAGTNLVNNGGTITNSSTGIIDAGGNIQNTSTINNGGSLTTDGTFTNDWGSTLNNTGNFYSTDNVMNNGSLTNSGDFNTDGDLTNNNTITNSSDMAVGGSLTNNWSTITNEGVLAVTEDVTNTGGITNEGNFLVDGSYDGAGNVSGTGNLCNSDGSTNPTTGDENVDCNICDDESGNLPVSLLHFNAEQKDGYIALKWQTASEINNDYFKVLKSDDGRNFHVIEIVDGNGNSNILLNYSSIDNYPNDGNNFYKLLQVDFDGGFSYSPTLVVRLNTENEVSVYPNFISGHENIVVETKGYAKSKIELFDSNGKIVGLFETIENQYAISTNSLKNGVYFLNITTSSKVISRVIVVERN